MKYIKIVFTILVALVIKQGAHSQNISLNILTQNIGIVKKNRIVFLEISVNNSDPTNYIGIYKLRVNINTPFSISSIDTTGHLLPTGWKITENNGKSLTLSNGMDMIATNDSRTILIAIRGNKVGGPEPISAQLSFSDGKAPGTETGILNGDLPADNYSTSTVQVIK